MGKKKLVGSNVAFQLTSKDPKNAAANFARVLSVQRALGKNARVQSVPRWWCSAARPADQGDRVQGIRGEAAARRRPPAQQTQAG